MALQSFNLCWFCDRYRYVFAVPSWSYRVDKKFHEQVSFFATIAPSIHFAFLTQRNGVSLACHCIFDLDVIFGKVLYQFEFFLLLGIAMTKFTIIAISIRIEVAICEKSYPDSPIATICSTPTDALYIFSGNLIRVGLVLLSQRKRLPALNAFDKILMNEIFRIIIK